MSVTRSYVEEVLPPCLGQIIMRYFGQSRVTFEMASFGQYEDCQASYAEQHGVMFLGACNGNHVPIIEMVAENKDSEDWELGLTYACQGGALDAVKFIIGKGAANLNDGLFDACYHKQYDVAEHLLAIGAGGINNCLRVTASYGSIKILNLLIAHGADDWTGSLISAHNSDHRDVAEFLIGYGVNRWNEYIPDCPLGHILAIKTLIKRGHIHCRICTHRLANHLCSGRKN